MVRNHNGGNKTYQFMSSRVYWPKMKKEIEKFCAQCPTCQLNKASNRSPYDQMLRTIMPEALQHWSIDLVGPMMQTERGNQWIYTAVDKGTRWIEAWPLREAKADIIVDILNTQIACRFGAIKSLTSDSGPQFIAKLYEKYCDDNYIKRIYSSTNNPRSNLVERSHKTIGDRLRTSREQQRLDEDAIHS